MKVNGTREKQVKQSEGNSTKDTDVHTGAPAVPPRINLILIYTFQ